MTRMGLHVHSADKTDALVDYCKRVQPNVMKTLDPNPNMLARVLAASPDTKIVFRPYWADQRFETHRDYIKYALHRAEPCRGLINWIEGWNEFAVRDGAQLYRFAQHEVRFAEAMLDAGFGAAIGGFSTGFLDEQSYMFDKALPILEMCHEHGGDNPSVIWHSHEYSAPHMQYGVRTPDGRNQWDHTTDSYTGVSDNINAFRDTTLGGWWILRYRDLWRKCVERGLTDVRMFFSETGCDDIQPRPGGQGKGWRDWYGREPWASVVGDFADQMRWYGWQISHDPYVLGWCDFGFATQDASWDSFDLSQTPAMLDKMAQQQALLPEGHYGGAPPVDKLDTLLRAEFGDRYDDVRSLVISTPDGPNGDFARIDPRTSFRGIAVHHSASDRDMYWYAVSEWHATRGFAGIGYHLGIRQGRVAYLGDIDTARAHVAGQNHRYAGICVMGNYEDAHGDDPTREDVTLLHRLVGVLDAYLGHELPVVGHYQVPGAATACPGARLKPAVASIRDGPGPFPAEGVRAAARAAQCAQPNPAAALKRAAEADGFYLIGEEADCEGFRCQLFREWRGEGERVYWARIGEWHDVGWILA